MNPILTKLLQLHEMDQELALLRKTIQEGPQAVSGAVAAAETARRARASIESTIKEKALALDACNLELRTAEADRDHAKAAIPGIKNKKEYQILTKRVKELSETISRREEEAIEIMEELDTLKADLQCKQATLDEAQATLDAIKEKVLIGAEKIREQGKAKRKVRDALAAEIKAEDPLAMQVYDEAYNRGKGEAVAFMINSTCQNCFHRATPNIENIVLAANNIKDMRCGCGCILVAGDVDTDASA